MSLFDKETGFSVQNPPGCLYQPGKWPARQFSVQIRCFLDVERSRLWSEQSACSCGDHKAYERMSMRGHGRKLVKTTNNLRTRGRRSSGKNSRNFHTLGYEMGNLPKWFFFIPNRYFFIPSKTISDREIFKVFFIPLKFFFMPLYIHFIPCENCFGFLLCFHFTPSTSISYPEHGISYQVAKFLYPTQPISY
jgi:hypothetical protein